MKPELTAESGIDLLINASPSVPVEKKDGFETRKFKTRDQSECEFKFLVVDRPERWPEATHFHSVYEMPLLGNTKKIHFHLTGVSLAEWDKMEVEHDIPDWNGDGKPDDDFLAKRQQVVNEKMAHVFEISIGKKLPGSTWAEKADVLKKLNPGEVEALYHYVQNVACNYRDGRILANFAALSADRVETAEDMIEFTDYAEWAKVTESAYFFRMQRAFEDYILEFPLKNMGSDTRSQIEIETRDPDPPKKPKRDPRTERLVPGETVPDLNDPHWRARCRVVAQKRAVLYFNACLPFTLPGSNHLEQYEWLSKRLMGDVVRLKSFIEEELCGYASRYSFFTSI